MNSNLRDRSLIASLTPYIDAAIRASPCTCATLRSSAILELVLKHGLDSQGRIPEFQQLCYGAQANFSQALSKHMNSPETRSRINDTYHTLVPTSQIGERNDSLNSLYQRYNLGRVVRDCEEIAVAYNASLWYMWDNTTTLSRYMDGNGELESMLATRQFSSNVHEFVATSITQSPWFNDRNVSCSIKVTDHYRKYASPLTYTSVFAISDPEVLPGPKSFRFLEDEIRLKNGTPIEDGTLEITFHCERPMAKSRVRELIEAYAPLGPVYIKCTGSSKPVRADVLAK